MSSPTSARAMASRMAGVGLRTVSLRRSIASEDVFQGGVTLRHRERGRHSSKFSSCRVPACYTGAHFGAPWSIASFSDPICSGRAAGVAAFGLVVRLFFLPPAGTILRPVRDEMAIQGGVQNLPWMMTATFSPCWQSPAVRLVVRTVFPLSVAPRRLSLLHHEPAGVVPIG